MVWMPRELADGSILPSAVGAQPKSSPLTRAKTLGAMCEGIVIAVYYPDEESRSWAKGTQKCVTCDVRLVGVTGKAKYVPRAEVLQAQHGLHDEDLWIPRAAAQNIEGGSLVVQAKGTGAGTKLTPGESVDADHVLVTWLDNNPNRPVILPYCVPHPNTRRPLTSSQGRVRRIRHHGVQVEWDKDGNWTLDATGAAKQVLGAKGTETSNSGTGGKITMTTKDGAGATSTFLMDHLGGVKVTDGSGGYIEMIKSSKTIKVQCPGGTFDLDTGEISAIATGTANLNGSKVLLGDKALAPTEALVQGNTWKTITTDYLGEMTTALTAWSGANASWNSVISAALVLLLIPAVGNTLFVALFGAAWAAQITAESTQSLAMLTATTKLNGLLSSALSSRSFTE
jgi:hypothetical protein